MPICKLIRMGVLVAGVALVPGLAQSGDGSNSKSSVPEEASYLYAGGRRVAIKPIDQVGFGGRGHGEVGWVLGGGLAAIVLLLGSGALLTAKALK